MSSRVHFRYRSYQLRARAARRAGCKRFVQVLHRRAGKDRSWLSITLEAMLERVGVYFHVFPSLNQGRRDLWDNIVLDNSDGVERSVKMISMFPPELVRAVNETEMQITLINGSVWQIMGADSAEAIERLRGPNPLGIVFSEYSFMLEGAWTTLEPVLLENGGWAAFIYTPKDESHGFTLYNYARESSEWFCELLTIAQTSRDAEGEDGSPVIREADIDELRNRGVREEDIQREYYCSFKGFLHGTIFGDLVAAARLDSRITRVPYIVNIPVGLCLDIGVSDMTAIWFYQMPDKNRINFIDYYEENLKTAQYFARLLKEQRPYMYGRLVVPWDGKWSAADYFVSVGFRGVDVAVKMPIQAGIDKVREKFSQFYFDEQKCARGVQCLERYARPWDPIKKSFGQTPVHDEYSHGASAMRTGAVAGFGPLEFYPGAGADLKVETAFDPRGLSPLSIGGL